MKKNKKNTFWAVVHVVHERIYRIEAENEDDVKIKVIELDHASELHNKKYCECENLINKKISFIEKINEPKDKKTVIYQIEKQDEEKRIR